MSLRLSAQIGYKRKKRVEMILEYLKEPLKAGIAITVVTRPIESYKEKDLIIEYVELLQPVIYMVQKPNIHQK